MGAWNLADPQIEFVFGRVDDALKVELQAFWGKHGDSFWAEMEAFAAVRLNGDLALNPSPRPLRRQPGAIARGAGGEIVAVLFVLLREVSGKPILGTHAYYQRIYVIPTARSLRLVNRLFKAFLAGFENATERRDPRAKALMSVHDNPGLKMAYVRAYFARLGFRLLGENKFGNEVWTKKLQTRFVF